MVLIPHPILQFEEWCQTRAEGGLARRSLLQSSCAFCGERMYLEFEEWFQFEHGSMITNKKLIRRLATGSFYGDS